jgi:hypothetical protein
MAGIAYEAATIFFSVFIGLSVLWSAMRVMTLRQRLVHAAFAGLVSACATIAVMLMVAV